MLAASAKRQDDLSSAISDLTRRSEERREASAEMERRVEVMQENVAELQLVFIFPFLFHLCCLFLVSSWLHTFASCDQRHTAEPALIPLMLARVIYFLSPPSPRRSVFDVAQFRHKSAALVMSTLQSDINNCHRRARRSVQIHSAHVTARKKLMEDGKVTKRRSV